MNQQRFKLNCGKNKAFIFTIDALIAVTLAVAVFGAGIWFLESSDSLVTLQLSRVGYDVLSVIDSLSIWEQPSQIELQIGLLLPAQYALILQEKCAGETLNLAKVNTISYDLPNKDIVSGQRIFLKESDYCIARYYLWVI